MAQLQVLSNRRLGSTSPTRDLIGVPWPLAQVAARIATTRSAGWPVLLLVGLLATVAYYALPQAGNAQAVVLCSVNASGSIGAWVAARRASGNARVVWVALGTGMALSTLANIPYYGYPLLTGGELPFPSIVDGFWLLTYPCFAVALWALARERHSDDYAGNLVDSLIIATGGCALLWTLVLGPLIDAAGLSTAADVVSVLYPTADLVVFALLVRLLVGSRGNASMYLLVASFVLLLVSDTVYSMQVGNGSYHYGGPCDGMWMLSYLLIGVAALHPTARSFPTTPAQISHRLTPRRLGFLTISALTGPIVLATQPDDMPWIEALSVVSFLLIFIRMAWLNLRLMTATRDVEDKTDELHHQALHDAATGLPNRLLITDRIDEMQARNDRNGTECAVLLVELNGLKNINDALGRGAGDQLLAAAAARLTTTLHDVDAIGRIGDGFAVLIGAVSLNHAPVLVAERIRDVMRQPFEIDGTGPPHVITASIGIATALPGAPTDLLRSADVALDQAKATGKDSYEIFQPEMATAVQRRYELEMDLRVALDDGQFRLMYQPVYDLGDLHLTGFEALLRWVHPTRGMVQPNEFVPVLESSGLIVAVGRWVLNEACRQLAAWRSAGNDLTVAVNVSARQLDRDDVVDHVREALAASRLDPRALTVEITETALMQNVDATADRLCELKDLGVQIAIDDFGTGYSSLAYLQQFPVDCLKIDRTFVATIADSAESDALLHTLVQLGKALGLKTLAEGVETPAQLAHLRAERVDAMQGYLLSKPLTPESVEAGLLHRPSTLLARQPRERALVAVRQSTARQASARQPA